MAVPPPIGEQTEETFLPVKFVQLRKIMAAAGAEAAPGNPATYLYGSICSTGHSLPVEYTIEGWLAANPTIGRQVEVLRCSRNETLALGIFTSSNVVSLWSGGFSTGNSIYEMVDIQPHPRVARAHHLARRLFTTDAAAVLWLVSPAPALDGQRPLDLLHTDAGARDVEAVLEGIAHGNVL